MSEGRSNRRWFRFSLATMFVVVAVSGVAIGWTGYQLSWIRQRQAFLSAHATDDSKPIRLSNGRTIMVPTRRQPVLSGIGTVSAPSMLGLLGEPGIGKIWLYPGDDHPDTQETARRLFPEAVVRGGKWPSAGSNLP